MMTLTESIWVLVILLLILIILLTDPKSSAAGVDSNELTMLFSSATEGQEFLQNVAWALITGFIILTLVIH